MLLKKPVPTTELLSEMARFTYQLEMAQIADQDQML